MTWDGTTTVHNNWGSSPTEMAPLKASLELYIKADSIRIYPLDPRGQKSETVYSYASTQPNIFVIELDQNRDKTVWYGIEKTGVGTKVESKKDAAPESYSLLSISPNPFNPITTIDYRVPKAADIKIEIYDARGRFVQTLVDEFLPAGEYSAAFHAGAFPSGAYFCRMKTGSEEIIEAMTVVK